MRRLARCLAIVILTLTMCVGLVRAESGGATAGIQWQAYSPAVFEQSNKTGHPILVLIKSSACHWCQQMDKSTWPDPALVKLINANFIPVIVGIEKDLNVAVGYGVSALPSTIIVDSKNTVIKSLKGYYTPAEMLKNLQDVSSPSAVVTTSPAATQPAAPEPPKDNHPVLAGLPAGLHDQLIQKANAIYQQTPITLPLPMETFKYALSHADGVKAPGYTWMLSALDKEAALQDPVWGGFYSESTQGQILYSKQLMVQADALRLYALAYAYLHNADYLKSATLVIHYLNHFLRSPDGVYYTSQAAFSTDPDTNKKYYTQNDVQRRQQGVPSVNTAVYADENGMLITGLANYAMATGDSQVLADAMHAATWIRQNLGIPGGGFRHEKSENNTIYLSDSVAMANANHSLYLATANKAYLDAAISALHFADQYFQDTPGKKGFISAVDLSNTAAPSAEVLSPALNAEVVRIAGELYADTGDVTFQKMQSNAFDYLQTAGVIDSLPPAEMLMVEESVTNAPAHVVVVGSKSDPAAKKLYEAALTQLPMNARMAWWDKSEGPLLNADTDYPDTGHATAYICHGIQCSLPITDTDQLIQQLDAIMVNHAVPEAVAKANSSKNVIDLSDIISDSMNAEKVLADKHFILVILGFLGFGLLLSFTPCLLPLVPIMASIIVGNTIGVKKQKTFLLCLTYVVAMSFSYAILGMIAGAFGVYLQSYMQSTKMIVIFSLLFFLLALAMLDAYELSIPRVIQQKLNDWSNLQEGGRYLGVAIMGMLSSLIVSPCVSAPLVGVLGFITKTGNYTLGAIGLFFMGFGMGVPLLIITLFSTNILPRASKWNAQIKTFFGIILLGASVWMISRILSDALTMLLWAAFIIFTSIYMGITKRRVTSLFAKFWKLITIMLFVYGVALFYEALFISSDLYELLSQHRVAATQEALFKPVVSLSELEADLKTAAALRQPVILDFSAKWCTACMSLEHTVFKDEMVKSQLTKFMVLRVDLTTMTPESEALTKQFNIAGPPMMVFFNDHGKPVDVRAIGDMDVKSFSALLQTELSAAQ